ncbi:MAG: dienelactone hydrolase family protein [Gemmatimonadota bacterium]|nr:dienelactone hydrolase family protein [Gemmatimonadota bacterium]
MRIITGAAAAAAAVGIGFAFGRVRPAEAVDQHAGHDMVAMASETDFGAPMPGFQQSATLPAAGSTAMDRLNKSPRHGEWVMVKVGPTDSVSAWVVYPERRDKAPVVITIHENTGINAWTRAVADQLAAEGFIAIAPDLTTMFRSGDLRADPAQDEGRAAIPKVTPEIGNAAIDAVAKYGMSLPAALPKYGIVGFCWGGGRSFLHATHAPGLGASVVYYGSPPTVEQMQAVRAPVLGLYGGNDARITSTVPGADSTMKRLGKSYAYHVFDGAGHGFLRAQDQNEANLKAAQQAWPLTVKFFKQNLGG